MRISDWSSDVCSSDLVALRSKAQAGNKNEESLDASAATCDSHRSTVASGLKAAPDAFFPPAPVAAPAGLSLADHHDAVDPASPHPHCADRRHAAADPPAGSTHHHASRLRRLPRLARLAGTAAVVVRWDAS